MNRRSVLHAACLLALVGCGPSTRPANVTFAQSYPELDPTGLELTVNSAKIEGHADGSVVLRGKTILVFSKTEAHVPADGPNDSSVLMFSVSGNQVESNGKRGTFSPNDDALTLDGMSIAIRDNVPEVSLSGHRFSTKLKFDVIPPRAKRAALLLSLFILAISVHLDQQAATR